MLKRQESVMKSSPSRSRRENVPCHSNIGCMAGIFHLISKYHSRRRFLTSGEKQATNKRINKSQCKNKCKPKVEHENTNNSVYKPMKTETEKTLSFLENVISPPSVAVEVEAEVKRRTLMAALEKCDEDLKSISYIINALRSNEQKSSMNSVFRHFSHSHSLGIEHIVKTGVTVQQNKPQPQKDFFEKVISRVLNAQTVKAPLKNNKAKVKIVEEVNNDHIWGIDRELRKIILVLEDQVFKYLIEEFVRELIHDFVHLSFPTIYQIIPKPRIAQASCTEFTFVVPPLPLEACKRRLRF